MYDYKLEKPKLFTDEGQKAMIKTLVNAQKLLKDAGSFRIFNALENVDYPDTFFAMAILDRLVELGEIREVTSSKVKGQDRIFTFGINSRNS